MPTPNRLAELRRAAGIPQSALAAEFGVNTSTVCRWETGDRQIPDSAKLKLAERFDVSVCYVMGWPEMVCLEREAA